MSERNVQAFKRAVEAFNRRDIDAFLEDFDPEIEWHSLIGAMFGGEQSVYRGHSGMREGVRDMDEALADLQIEYSEVRDFGERLVVLGRARGRGRVSGAQVETPLNWVIEFRDGRAIRMTDYLNAEDALGAAGVSE